MGKEAKTNAMRILEREKVAYTAHEYPHEEGRGCGRRDRGCQHGRRPGMCVTRRW